MVAIGKTGTRVDRDSAVPVDKEVFPMSLTDADLTQRIDPEHIRRRRFAVAKRGFDPDQVREYLERVAEAMDRLEREAREARSEADAVVRGSRTARDDAYAELASRLSEVLRTADLHAEETRREAAEQAERTAVEARREAERTRLDAEGRAATARTEAEEILRRAKEEAERMLAGLASRRDAILADLQTMRERLVGVVERLETTMTSQDPLPEDVEAMLEAPTPPAAAAVPTVPHAAHAGITRSAHEPPVPDSIDLVLPEIPLLDDLGEDDHGDEDQDEHRVPDPFGYRPDR
jgi:DivIVA domain-containing protein